MKTIRELHDFFDQGKLTIDEHAGASLSAIEASSHNAVLTVLKDRALEQARKLATIRKGGKVPREKMPLWGVPIGVKDLFAIEGTRTTCASKVLENYVAPYTATAIARLEAAGAIVVGKLNMDEFAMGGSNENSAFGPVDHPTHPGYVPGGSSGGSATAVAAGLCHAAIGTDTGGSIRLPASFCGLRGMKPTYGRVSRYGMVAFASSLDQAGPMANSVEDCAVLLDVMSGHDPMDSTCVERPATRAREALTRDFDWKKLRVGVPEEFFSDGLDAEVGAAVKKSIDQMKARGARIVPVRLPHARHSVAVYYLVAVSEASSNLARFDGVRFGFRATDAPDLQALYRKSRAAFGPEVKRRILLGTFALSAGYSDEYFRRACQVRALVKKDFEAAFSQCDVIAGPVSPNVAFKRGEKSASPLQMYLNDLYTIPANLAGLPALSLPCGKNSQGLPMGLQLIAPAFEDERLLSVAHAFDKEGAL